MFNSKHTANWKAHWWEKDVLWSTNGKIAHYDDIACNHEQQSPSLPDINATSCSIRSEISFPFKKQYCEMWIELYSRLNNHSNVDKVQLTARGWKHEWNNINRNNKNNEYNQVTKCDCIKRVVLYLVCCVVWWCDYVTWWSGLSGNWYKTLSCYV